MSLNWNFNTDLIGYAEDYNGWRYPIYTGNCLMIFNAEKNIKDTDSFNYWLQNFYADEQHLKNCIKDKIYDGTEYKHIYLIACKQAFTFIKHAMNTWAITIYPDKPENREKFIKIREEIRNENHEN